MNSSLFTYNLSGANDEDKSMIVNFGSGDKSTAPVMKSFIMFRCGHRFHKHCI